MDNDTENIPGNEASEAPVNTGAQPISVGAVLREAREKLGLSKDEVFNHIKLAPRQITALEADDFAQLPEITFVRGFVRSYARLLKLDPAPLLAALPHAPAETAPLAKNTLAEVPFPNVYSARKPNIIWLSAALLVALALAIFTYMHSSDQKAPDPAVASHVKVETLELPPAEVLPESAVPPISQAGESAAPVQAHVAQPVLPKVRESAEAKAAVELPAPKVRNPLEPKASVELPAPSLRIDPSAAPARGTPVGTPPLRVDPSAAKVVQKEPGVLPKPAGILRMTFDDDSWVEVKDKDDKILLSQINPRGSELSLNGNPPLSLVIGRSASVHLYYKGKQIDLAPHTKVATARLTLE